MNTNKLVSAVVLAIAVATPIMAYRSSQFVGDPVPVAIARITADSSALDSFAGANAWLNSGPLMAADLRGKVVLVNFWTYSCINWRRQLPYVRAWADKYKDQGLVVVGVHTPEFEFEKNWNYIRAATGEMNVPYPVAVDSDYRIWTAFDNRFWPALYFIDAQGRVRHQVFGEGEYAESEKMIQRLLKESGAQHVPQDVVSIDAKGLEAAADSLELRTPETYVGYERAENFVSHAGVVRDRPSLYVLPKKPKTNQWALSGNWTVEGHRAVSNAADARIVYRFHARDLHLVMGSDGAPIRFRVTLDGRPPGADHGVDVNAQGYGVVTKPNLYQLIRQGGHVVDREFAIEFLEQGASAYSFTFG